MKPEIKENIYNHYKCLLKNVEDKEAAWKVIPRMDSYLTALRDVGMITYKEGCEMFTSFFHWEDFK